MNSGKTQVRTFPSPTSVYFDCQEIRVRIYVIVNSAILGQANLGRSHERARSQPPAQSGYYQRLFDLS